MPMKPPGRIYLDHASLTPIDQRVMAEMKEHSDARYANASSWYKEGVAAKKVLAEARKTVADFLHALPDEIAFTSGGTESNNIAIQGAVESLRAQGVEYEKMHVLVSVIEHSSVREVVNHLNGKGVRTGTIAVDPNGIVDLEDLRNKMRPNTVIVSVMAVNNEIGTVQPIREIAKIIRQARKKDDRFFDFQSFDYPMLHSDAAQAALYEDLNVQRSGVDLLTLDGSKICGPRGVGALFVKRGTPIVPIMYGGGQEDKLRSGTENIPAIMGFAKAIEIAGEEREKESGRIDRLKRFFWQELRKIQPKVVINPKAADPMIDRQTGAQVVDSVATSPHILNVSIPGINNEFFTIQLDAKGVAVSTKSSCLRDEDESYVLKSIGADSGDSVRFSFGRDTDKTALKRALRAIRGILDR